MTSDVIPLKKNTDPLFKKWKKEGSFVPLFVKLQDLNTDQKEEAPPLRYFSKEELQASVITNISDLLNTRVTLPAHVFNAIIQNDQFEGYPELYGLPDFSYFDASNQATWSYYTFLIKTAIERNESRLTNVSVVLEKFMPPFQTLQATISGDLIINEMTEPLSFNVTLTSSHTQRSPS
ncbi:MAG: type VI secretion system baseplate subunit TssE [Proteobacteria bacterium]|nr:type VI secretion system baseplate subunit TssE [Pseudomonadota bacterium]